MTDKIVTACVVTIGDEILSGRTKDANLSYIAGHLNEIGVQVREARVICDVEEVIVATINDVRTKYDYVFTTGGIGPTHDDITADSIAKAFGVGIGPHPDAVAVLEKHYKVTGQEFTTARQRMARIPHGGILIDNPVSRAPGFQLENVFVMAGVPKIMQVMLDSLTDRLEGGAKMLSRTLTAAIGEGTIAKPLAALQAEYANVSLGSYPYFQDKNYGTSIVMRSIDSEGLDAAAKAVKALMEGLGVEPIEGEAR